MLFFRIVENHLKDAKFSFFALSSVFTKIPLFYTLYFHFLLIICIFIKNTIHFFFNLYEFLLKFFSFVIFNTFISILFSQCSKNLGKTMGFYKFFSIFPIPFLLLLTLTIFCLSYFFPILSSSSSFF